VFDVPTDMVAPSPLESVHAGIVATDRARAADLVDTLQAMGMGEPAGDVLFDAPIPDDFLFAGPPQQPPPPAPTGLAAPPAGVEAQRAATAEAIDRVERNAPADWKAEADAAIRDVARRFAEFTADDVWDTGLTIPPTPSALGPVFRAAQAAGVCEPTDRVMPSRYAQRHRQLKVWRSVHVAPAHPPSPGGFAVTSCSTCERCANARRRRRRPRREPARQSGRRSERPAGVAGREPQPEAVAGRHVDQRPANRQSLRHLPRPRPP
jgi:hypothetical protein